MREHFVDLLEREVGGIGVRGEQYFQTEVKDLVRPICKVCENSKVEKVALPFVLRYLTNELAAMNIKLTYTVC